MNAIIMSVGDELVSGQTVDTNSAHIALELAGRGITAVEHVTMPDSRPEIAQAILLAANKVELLIISGGLGPTADDITRQALAEAMGTELELNEACLAELEAFFKIRHRQMNQTNKIQAYIPRGATPIPNPLGTAPGLRAAIGRTQIFVMPGVPSEMKKMLADHVLPAVGGSAGAAVIRILHTFGQGESDIASRIEDLMARGRNPLIGTTVAAGMVSVRLICRAADRQAAGKLSDQAIAELRGRLGNLVVGEGEQTMAGVAGELLRRKNATLATAESCTGGMIGQLVTSVSGSSDYYLGGIVSYSYEAKTALLDVPAELLAAHGAVSHQVAEAMAKGAKQRFASTWAISVTGIAGPTGGSEAKPVGLVFIGLAGPDGSIAVHRHILPGTRDIVRLRSSLTALNHLRLALI
ncbi:MAG: competence/damage-inducible protein A [Planctomycetes bacterium]|nr:competence/damage-inducible protein A [Planctomycetota bacterium]